MNHSCCGKGDHEQPNKKAPLLAILVVAFAVIALGIFLVKQSPAKPKTQGQTAAVSGSFNDLVGKSLPAIALTNERGQTYDLASLRGKNTVLFFNEGLMCYPACWDQMVAFGQDQRFQSSDVTAVSVVVDRPQDWQQAIAKMPDLANAPTLFDGGAAASRQLGLLSLPSSMHKGSLPGHTYIVLDKDGVVRYVNDDPNMTINNDLLWQKMEKF